VLEFECWGKYFANKACMSLLMAAISFFCSLIVAVRSLFGGLWLVGVFGVGRVKDIFAFSISMSVDGAGQGMTWVEMMAFRSCSTAVTIVVFS